MKQNRLTINIDPELLTSFKVLCIQNGLTMTEVIVKFIEEFRKTYENQ